MNPLKDGGPAFPLQSIGPEFTAGYAGMSLRDWFAGQIACGMHANKDLSFLAEELPNLTNLMSEACFEAADAMIAAREKGTK